jgi:hypothetical protein
MHGGGLTRATTDMPTTYQSSLQRLRELPATFSGRDLTVKFQWSSATASQYLANWRRAQLVRALGGHSDIYMNLVVAPQADLEQALRRALPEAVLIGADVIRQAGWTTQILQVPDIAILHSSPRYKLIDFNQQTRSAKWFKRVRPGLIDPHGGVRRLAPAWALADMLNRFLDRRVKGAWLVAPDDLEWDDIAAAPDAATALAAFGLAADSFAPAGYARIHDAQAISGPQILR